MKMSVEQHGKVTILRPLGNLTIGEGDIVLREALEEQLKAGHQHLVLDMKNVKYVDSAGLGELVASLKKSKEAGGNLKLAALNDSVNNLMILTKLMQIFVIHTTEVDAVSSYV